MVSVDGVVTGCEYDGLALVEPLVLDASLPVALEEGVDVPVAAPVPVVFVVSELWLEVAPAAPGSFGFEEGEVGVADGVVVEGEVVAGVVDCVSVVLLGEVVDCPAVPVVSVVEGVVLVEEPTVPVVVLVLGVVVA